MADVCNGDRDAMRDDEFLEGEDYDPATQDVLASVERQQGFKARQLGLGHCPVTESQPAGVTVEVDDDGNQFIIDESFDDATHVAKYADVSFPSQEYTEVDYFPSGVLENIVLVIGSEMGLSSQAKKFVSDNFGKQVTIPLLGGIDSLNTSVACGVILYEVLRQARQSAVKTRGRAGHATMQTVHE